MKIYSKLLLSFLKAQTYVLVFVANAIDFLVPTKLPILKWLGVGDESSTGQWVYMGEDFCLDSVLSHHHPQSYCK